MEQAWFEMTDMRKEQYQTSPWVPLRSTTKETTGRALVPGYQQQFYGVTTWAFPAADQAAAELQTWRDLGLAHAFGGYVDDGEYIPSDEIVLTPDGTAPATDPVRGLALVLEAGEVNGELAEWHLHQDFVVSLGLRRQGDTWVRPAEGYREVARLRRDPEGAPVHLEVAREFLLDYLSARNMGLYLTTLRERRAVFADEPAFSWPGGRMNQQLGAGDRLSGVISPIHEGTGLLYGTGIYVQHVQRVDPKTDEDLPVLSENDDVRSTTSLKRSTGRKVFSVIGQRFRNEWLGSGDYSPRVRGDEERQHVEFHLDASGTTQPLTPQVLNRYLWFRPDVVPALLKIPKSQLAWDTRDTGTLAANLDERIPFGVNAIGLVNVLAADVAGLPNWQQRLLAAHSVTPDARVSAELLASQGQATPATTTAPEVLLWDAVNQLNAAAQQAWGAPLIDGQAGGSQEGEACHRFRADSQGGLLALAKDLTRLLIEQLDTALLRRHIPQPVLSKKPDIKSRAALQEVIATQVGEDAAKTMLGPLAGLYDLRLNDAHHAPEKVKSGLRLLRIDSAQSWPLQGAQMLQATANTILEIARVLQRWPASTPPGSPGQPGAPEGPDEAATPRS